MTTTETINSEEVLREESSHGEKWNKIHDGYFSSPEVAVPFVAKIAETLQVNNPDIITDLGGGTGFILDQLSERCNSNIKLVNLELSEEQLAANQDSHITSLNRSIATFNRADLGNADSNILFISRSTLHYAGENGLKPLLAHIRSQMKIGEFFIHQTACFADKKSADTMNLLYKLIGTDKWYPTVETLCNTFDKTGFELIHSSDAPTLNLTSDDLSNRYNVKQSEIPEILNKLQEETKTVNRVFTPTQDGFTAYLPYTIFICRAGEG